MRNITGIVHMPWRRVGFAVAMLAAAGLLTLTVKSQERPKGPGFGFGEKKPPIPWKGKRRTEAVAKNMKLVGWTDMNGHADGNEITGQVINGRDYIFLAHYWSQGITIVDVTDPAKPETVSFIPCDVPFGKTSKLAINGTVLLTGLRPLELDERHVLPYHGWYFYDVSDPRHPKKLSFFKTADQDEKLTDGAHFLHFVAPFNYAYLATPVNGFQGNVFMIVDAADPKNPKEVGRWWAPGQHVAGGEKYIRGETPQMHGAQANRDQTLGFFGIMSDPPGGLIILDIKDKAHPKQLSYLKLNPPFPDGYFGVHHVTTMDSRKILIGQNEGAGNALTRPQMTGWVIDYADPTKPRVLSVLPIPEGIDRTEPVRFGPHNTHENEPQGLVDDYMFYIAWFRAGVRVFDLSDPKHPENVGFFEPPDPKYRMDAMTWSGKPGDPNGSELSSLNQVYVDKRGLIYATGYNDGLYILEYTGPRPAESKKALEEARKQHDALVAKK